MNPETLATVVEDAAVLAGLTLTALPLDRVPVLVGEPEDRHRRIPKGHDGPPPEGLVLSGVQVAVYVLARRKGGGWVLFRADPDGVLHRCHATHGLRQILAPLALRLVWDRLRDQPTEVGPLEAMLPIPAEGDGFAYLPPNPVVNQPKKVLTPEEKAAKKAAKSGKGEAMSATPTVPVAKTTPGPKVPVKGPSPKPPRPQPSPSAAPTALAARVRAREDAKA